MSANRRLIDIHTRHAVFVERYAAGRWNTILPVLLSLAQSLENKLATSAMTADQMVMSKALLRDVRDLITEASDAINNQLSLDLRDFADYEIGFNEKALQPLVKVPLSGVSPETVAATVVNSGLVLVSGKDITYTTLNSMLKDFSGTAYKDVMTVIRAGSISGTATREIAAEVGRLVKTRTSKQAEAVVRTALASVSAQATKELAQANQDVLKGEKWVATLDARTTLICAGRDGEIYPVGEGPHPPAHYRCRSRRVPVIDPKYAVPGFEGQRASYSGPVSASSTYGGWLKKQPAEFQDEVLGPERAALFRAGKVDIKGFTDDTGRTYSLNELHSKLGMVLG